MHSYGDIVTPKKILQIITRFSSSDKLSENLSNNSIWWDGPLFSKEIKGRCLFAEDMLGYKKHEMYEKIADEFNEETFSKRQI